MPNPYGFSTKEFSSQSGLIYFGARYYNPQTGRWLKPDPLGMVNGPNLYAYCRNNPTNWLDPYGLFVFGHRPLEFKWRKWTWRPWIHFYSSNPISNYSNTELSHEHGFFEDGSGDNIGFGPNGRFPEDPTGMGYRYDTTHYDDALIREALKNINDGKYSNWPWNKNNCQDWAERLRDEYERLKEQNGKYDECNQGGPTNPDTP